jgi:hypothetical protein
MERLWWLRIYWRTTNISIRKLIIKEKERKIMIETLRAIGLVVFMQLLSLALEFIDTGTLKPSVRKRVVVELIVLSVYVAGMTVFKGMISDELISLVGTVYLAVVVSHLYKFLTNKKEEIDGGDKEE